MGDAIDSAEVQRFIEAAVEVLLAEIRGQVISVFDCTAVHIDDVKGAIGAIEQVDRAESFVGGCEELGLGVRINGVEQAVGFDQDVAPDKVCGWFAQKDISVELRGELMAAIDERAAGGGERGEGAIGPEGAGLIAAIDAWVDPTGPDGLIFREPDVGAGGGVRGVAGQVTRREQVTAELIGIGIKEKAAEIVLSESPLAAEGGGIALPEAGCVAETGGVIGAVNPVIEGPEGIVGGMLGIGFHAEVGIGFGGIIVGHQAAFVSPAIAVGVAAEPEVGRFGDEEAMADEHQAAGHDEAIEEDGGFIHSAVVVGVFKDGNAAGGLGFADTIEVGHEGAHFDDPEASIGSEGRGDGRFDQRFVGDEIDGEIGWDGEGFEGLIRSERWGWGDFFGGDGSGLRFAGLISALGGG